MFFNPFFKFMCINIYSIVPALFLRRLRAALSSRGETRSHGTAASLQTTIQDWQFFFPAAIVQNQPCFPKCVSNFQKKNDLRRNKVWQIQVINTFSFFVSQSWDFSDQKYKLFTCNSGPEGTKYCRSNLIRTNLFPREYKLRMILKNIHKVKMPAFHRCLDIIVVVSSSSLITTRLSSFTGDLLLLWFKAACI